MRGAGWRRLRAGKRRSSSRPGGSGSSSGPTTWLCLQWLDADRMKAGESLPDRRRKRPSCPGSTIPPPKIAATVRRKAMRDAGLSTRQACRFASLHPLRLSAFRPLIQARGIVGRGGVRDACGRRRVRDPFSQSIHPIEHRERCDDGAIQAARSLWFSRHGKSARQGRDARRAHRARL